MIGKYLFYQHFPQNEGKIKGNVCIQVLLYDSEGVHSEMRSVGIQVKYGFKRKSAKMQFFNSAAFLR